MIKDAESSDWDTLPEKTEQVDSSTAIFLFYHLNIPPVSESEDANWWSSHLKDTTPVISSAQTTAHTPITNMIVVVFTNRKSNEKVYLSPSPGFFSVSWSAWRTSASLRSPLTSPAVFRDSLPSTPMAEGTTSSRGECNGVCQEIDIIKL